MLLSIEIRNLRQDRRLDMKDGIVLDGFPSTGLLNAIASECLIRSSGTELFAIIDSPQFPALSIISNSMPSFPARLHINEALKVAFFISEFNIDPRIQSTMGKVILNWALQNKCKMIISAAGVLSKKQDMESDASVNPDEQPIFAVASTPSATKIVKQNNFIELKSGWIGGIPATLLNEGSLVGLDVIVLVVDTISDVPDFRASALVSNAITKLVPGLHCDIASLIVEAELVENKMKQVRDGHKESSYIT
jgi:uncharacterized protein